MTGRPDFRTGGATGPAWRAHRDFARTFASLEDIHAFVQPALDARGIEAAATYAVIMSIEELFTNMVKYNAAGRGPISLEIKGTANAVTCRLSDPDSACFDMTRTPDVDIHQPVEQRQPGGLGLHLIRRMVDSIEYDYHGRCSRVSFVKNLRRARPRDGMLQP